MLGSSSPLNTGPMTLEIGFLLTLYFAISYFYKNSNLYFEVVVKKIHVNNRIYPIFQLIYYLCKS
jgi:hypothetical protein